jgi:hypothetical protein
MSERNWKLDRQFMLRQLSRLSGLAKFPAVSETMKLATVEALIDDLLLTLDEACVSEEHVSQTIAEWKYANDFFPTEHQLREQAWSIRQRYEPSFRVTEEPKASPMEMTPELRAAWDKAVEAVDRQKEMWSAIKRELRITDFAKVTWLQIAECKLKLGYPLNRADQDALAIQRERPAAWDAPQKREPLPPLPQKLISAADFEQARRELEKKKFGDDS